MVNMAYGPESILEEIDKCDLVCANCHRIRTAERDKPWTDKLRKYDRSTWEQAPVEITVSNRTSEHETKLKQTMSVGYEHYELWD